MIDKKLIEQIAMVIQIDTNTLDREEDEAVGVSVIAWDNLYEYQREKYRSHAKRVLEYLKYNGQLRI
jgi:hypothetical protein